MKLLVERENSAATGLINALILIAWAALCIFTAVELWPYTGFGK